MLNTTAGISLSFSYSSIEAYSLLFYICVWVSFVYLFLSIPILQYMSGGGALSYERAAGPLSLL